MKKNTLPRWLEWAREIQALAQTGDMYAVNEWQHERYQRLMEIAAEIVNAQTGLLVEPIIQNFHIQPGYATPKIDLRGAVFQDNKLLMVQERSDGGWTMPGGWADVLDTPSGGVEREILEESGFRVKARKLVGVYDANRVEPIEFYHAYKLVFLCDLLGGHSKLSNETTAVAFFSEDEIPKNFAGERTKLKHVMDAFATFRNPSSPTVFD